ncbi:MAG: hypothetical protein E6I52_11860, partial [Chloroflexi bacterium]
QVNLHYGPAPGVKLYTHLSDQYGPYHTTTISATASEAPYLVDGLLYHETDLEIAEHYSDTGAYTVTWTPVAWRHDPGGYRSRRMMRPGRCTCASNASATLMARGRSRYWRMTAIRFPSSPGSSVIWPRATARQTRSWPTPTIRATSGCFWPATALPGRNSDLGTRSISWSTCARCPAGGRGSDSA